MAASTANPPRASRAPLRGRSSSGVNLRSCANLASLDRSSRRDAARKAVQRGLAYGHRPLDASSNEHLSIRAGIAGSRTWDLSGPPKTPNAKVKFRRRVTCPTAPSSPFLLHCDQIHTHIPIKECRGHCEEASQAQRCPLTCVAALRPPSIIREEKFEGPFPPLTYTE